MSRARRTAGQTLLADARLLPVSAYDRLHLNVWTAAEDRLVSPEDLAACVTLDGPQPPDPRHRYVIELDLGLKHDRTMLAVCHDRSTPPDPPDAIAAPDRAGSAARADGHPARPVQLADVEAVAHQAASDYRAPDPAGPWQAVGLAQRLRVRGVGVTEWTFSPSRSGGWR